MLEEAGDKSLWGITTLVDAEFVAWIRERWRSAVLRRLASFF